MKAPLLLLPLAAFAAVLGGCSTAQPPLPMVHYPVTYQVPIGNIAAVQTPAAAPSAAAKDSADSTQDVEAQPAVPLYYTINSPVAVKVYMYEKIGAGPNGNLLGEMQVPGGSPMTSQVTPRSNGLEFVFSPTQTNSSGTLQFTLSAQPLAGEPTPLGR